MYIIKIKTQAQYDEAMEYYNKALVIYEPTIGIEHIDVGVTYNNIV